MTDFDPVTIASQLASAYVQSTQKQLTARTQAAQRISTALSTLRSALSTFDTAIAGLTSTSGTQGLREFSATVDNAAIATASASSKAQPGTYSFHVEQLATAHQVAFEDLSAVPVVLGGPLTVQLADGSSFNVNLVGADTDGDGSISQAEIARAINQAEGNEGKVTAAVMNMGGQTRLLLSSGSTGADQAISLDTSALPAGALKDALQAPQELVAARDAIVWLGGQGGLQMQQGTNTFTGIEGVSVTFTRAMASGDTPVTLTVAADASGTAANVQKFVDAYNVLAKALDSLTKVDTTSGESAAFATDAGVRSLRSRLNTLIRQDFDGLTLVDLGIKANRDGTLTLDQSRLERTLSAHPDALDSVFGKASLTQNSGVLGALNQYLETWLKSGSGQIASRTSTLELMQKRLDERQVRIDAQYDMFYERYLKQFTQLQSLQAQMSQTSGLFTDAGIV